MRLADATRHLERLAVRLNRDEIDTADEWAGADVMISGTAAPSKSPGFYPEPRRVVTPNACELSWLFIQIRDAFASVYDGATKIELFGRLANAALRYQRRCGGKEDTIDLLAAVLHEAFAIADEMEEGSFQFFTVAIGNEIVDDYIDDAERNGFVGVDETRRFLAEKGVEL